MEIREWTYEEFPAFAEEVPGAKVIQTTGDEVGVQYMHDVEYATVEGTPLHLQILIPACRNDRFQPFAEEQSFARPCVVFVQGSAWFQQYVYMKVADMGRLARRGYVCAIVEYRHSGIAPFPAQAIDARNAIRFLRANAKRFGIDPERMIVAGDSSGGHTAMWAGLHHNDDTEENLFPGVSAEVKGIVNYYGSISVMLEDSYPSTLNHHLPDSPEGQEMGGVNLREHPELCRALSVEENIDENTDVAPTLIFHGTKDRTVNTKQSVLLFNKMKQAGKDVRLYLIDGADHGGPEFWTEEVLDIVEGFMREQFAK